MSFERRDDRLEGGERTGSEIVSPCKAAGQQDGLGLGGEDARAAIDEGRGGRGDLAECGEEVVFAIGARKADDGAGKGREHGGSVADG